MNEKINMEGYVNVRTFSFSKPKLMFIKLLQLFNKGRFAAQTIGRFTNFFVNNFGTLEAETGFQKNVITNGALAVFSGLVGNTGAQTAFGYLGLGTDSTAALASQTTLVAEIVDTGLSRVAATVSRTTTTQTSDTLQLVGSWTASGSKTVQEIGVFNAVSSGVMAARKVVTATSIVNTNVVSATYKIIFS